MAMKRLDPDYFNNWNYKKHAKLCTAVYLGLYAFDMTVSYFIKKNYLTRYINEDWHSIRYTWTYLTHPGVTTDGIMTKMGY